MALTVYIDSPMTSWMDSSRKFHVSSRILCIHPPMTKGWTAFCSLILLERTKRNKGWLWIFPGNTHSSPFEYCHSWYLYDGDDDVCGCVYLCVYLCVHGQIWAQECRGLRKSPGPDCPRTGVPGRCDQPNRVLGTKLRSCAGAAYGLSHWAVSPGPEGYSKASNVTSRWKSKHFLLRTWQNTLQPPQKRSLKSRHEPYINNNLKNPGLSCEKSWDLLS